MRKDTTKLTKLICDFLNDIQNKHTYTHEDIISGTLGEGIFICSLYEKAELYFKMKENGIILETNIDELI